MITFTDSDKKIIKDTYKIILLYLKDYWKLIVKNEKDLSDEKKYSKHFHKDMSQRDIGREVQ